jgi:hypothetical protein
LLPQPANCYKVNVLETLLLFGMKVEEGDLAHAAKLARLEIEPLKLLISHASNSVIER